MSDKQQLTERKRQLERELSEVNAEIIAIQLREIRDKFGVYVGCVVECRGSKYRVSRVGTGYGTQYKPSIYGNKQTKTGWHPVKTYIGGGYVVVTEENA